MSDPNRLRSEGSEFEQRLLEAAGSEAPPPELVLSMQQALGFASGTAGTATVAAKGGLAAWWSLGIAVTALGVGVGAWQLARPSDAPLSPRVGQTAAPLAKGAIPASGLASERVPPPPAPVAAGATPIEPAPPRIGEEAAPGVPHGKRRQPPPGHFKGDLRQEIELIDRARSAVSRRAPEQALEALHQYFAEYPRGAFAPEAQVLRIEALEQSGRHAQSLSLAKGFLARHPDSPLAERVAKSVGLTRAD